MLNWGFKKFDTIKVTKKNEVFVDLDVWLGKKNKVKVVPNEDYYLTIPKRKKKTVKAILEYEGPLQAPINKGEKVAMLSIYVSGELKNQIDLLSAEDIKRSHIFSRLIKSINYLVWGDV
jgi:D-alanyl-D-alanine carboxypeptidase (penicillin-binding protein 5/6)